MTDPIDDWDAGAEPSAPGDAIVTDDPPADDEPTESTTDEAPDEALEDKP